MTVHMRFTRPDGSFGLTTSLGRYLDEWSGVTGAGGSPPGATCTTPMRPGTRRRQFDVAGARDRTDPVYDLLEGQ